MPDLDNMVSGLLGTWDEGLINAINSPAADGVTEGNLTPPDTSIFKGYTRGSVESAFDPERDFQVGSVILPVPPLAVEVRRVRDVLVTPILRGQSVPVRAGQGLLTIDISLDIPTLYNPGGTGTGTPLTQIIAELKTCPFTVLRSRDLASKIMQRDPKALPQRTQEALLNIARFGGAEQGMRSLLSIFLVRQSQIGADLNATWQKRFEALRDEMISRIGTYQSAGWEAEFVDNPAITENLYDSPNPDAYRADLGTVASSKAWKWLVQFRDLMMGAKNTAGQGRDAFGSSLWDRWEGHWSNPEFILTFIKLYHQLVQSANEQRNINDRAAGDTSTTFVPPDYVPVAFQRMVVNTIPGKPGRLRVDMSFELFNHTAYTDRLLWHTSRDGRWTVTDNPAEADLLLRWRDTQYLDSQAAKGAVGYRDMSGITLEALNAKIDLPAGSKDVVLGDKIPGYFDYMRAAWNNRRGRFPSSDPRKHKLVLFYPENTPQIPSSLATPEGTFYRQITLDDPENPENPGINQAVQIVWQVGMARQTDEYTGMVTHQFTGGSTFQVKFDVTIPTHYEDGDRDLTRDLPKRHEQLLGELNKMYNTLDNNRRFLPSEAWMPTTVFVKHQLTEMFGAYCFEATDLPVVQDSPGKISVALQLVEALPVVGLGHVEASKTTGPKRATPEEAWKLLYELYKWNGPTVRNAVREQLLRVVGVQQLGVKRDAHIQMYRKLTLDEAVAELYLIAQDAGVKLVDTPQPGYVDYEPFDERDIKRWEYILRFGRHYWGIDTRDSVDLLRDQVQYIVLESLFRTRPSNISDAEFPPSVFTEASGDKPARVHLYDPARITRDLLRTMEVSGGTDYLDITQVYKYFVNTDKVRQAASVALSAFIANGADGTIIASLRKSGVPASTSAETLRAFFSVEPTETIDAATRSMTAQLYPDLVLPTYRELFQIPPGVDEFGAQFQQDMRWFVPSWSEVGVVRVNEATQLAPSRRIDDIADPDVWFVRDYARLTFTDGPNVKLESRGSSYIDPEHTHSPPSVAGQKRIPFRSVDTIVYEAITDQAIATVDGVQSYRNLEAEFRPNTRRMLWAFPTYNLEFVLEATRYKPITETSDPPFHYQARLVNRLPITNLVVYEDTERPCRAEINFIGRRSALRNESWMFLEPRIQHESATFSNSVKKFKEYLQTKGIRNDPTFITRHLMQEGTRVVVRMGYGTDLNNDRMLPVKISGTIGEVALGEQSSMIVQSLGTQFWNPINTTIGGTGNYSPNRLWSGKYTLRAIGDIISALDLRWMGRSGTGLENDLPQLTDDDIKRIYAIAVTTRTTVQILTNIIGQASAFYAALSQWLSSLFGYGNLPKSRSAEAAKAISDLATDPATNFYPELLNVYPIVTGISDWAISNTDTHHLPANYWMDMMCRLNPGAVWWTHPFGDEARLFYGRPDQLYRELPLPTNGSEVSTTMAALTPVRPDSTGISYDIRERFLEINGVRQGSANLTPRFSSLSGDFYVEIRDALRKEQRERGSGITQLSYAKAMPLFLKYHARINRFYGTKSPADGFNTLVGIAGEDIVLFRELMRRDLELVAIPYSPELLNPRASSEGADGERIRGALQILSIDEKFATAFRSGEDFFSWFRQAVEHPDEVLKLPAGSTISDEAISTALWASAVRVGRMLSYVLSSSKLAAQLMGQLSGLKAWNNQMARNRWALGYRRFRRVHYALSGTNILTNMIQATQSHMANSVDVDKYIVGYNVLPQERRIMSLEADLEKLNFGIFQWFKGLVGKNDRDDILGLLIPTSLAEGMSRMYEGQLVLRGDPHIKPHDTIYTLDLHNGLYGPVRVCNVVHSFDATSGYVTAVGAGMHTQAQASRALAEHVAIQRVAKTIAWGAIVAGTGLILSAPLLGPLAAWGGGTLALGGGALLGFAELRDSVGRARLQNFSLRGAFAGNVGTRSGRRAMEALLLDNFIGSNNWRLISPIEDTKFLSKLRDIHDRSLGVTIFPLIKIGSGSPFVAGITSGGIADIDDTGGIEGGVTRDTLETLKDGYETLMMVVNGRITDVSDGANAITNTIKAAIDTAERNRAALEQRIPGITQ